MRWSGVAVISGESDTMRTTRMRSMRPLLVKRQHISRGRKTWGHLSAGSVWSVRTRTSSASTVCNVSSQRHTAANDAGTLGMPSLRPRTSARFGLNL